jgi:hypothetical protein
MKALVLLGLATLLGIFGIALFWHVQDLKNFNEVRKMRIAFLNGLLASECVEIKEAIPVLEQLGLDFEVINDVQRKDGQTAAIGLRVQFEPVVAFSKDGGRIQYFLKSGSACLMIGS